MYATLPKSLRETKLVTNVKVEEDEQVLKTRQEIVNTKSVSELSQITSFSDIPVPTRLSRMVTRGQVASGTRSESRAKSTDKGDLTSNATKSLRREHFLYVIVTLDLHGQTVFTILFSAKLTSMTCTPLCPSP